MRSPVNAIYWEMFGPQCHGRAARWQSKVKLAPLMLLRQWTVRVGSIALFVFDGPSGGVIFAVAPHGPTTTASAFGIARERPPRAPPAAPSRRVAPGRGLALAAGGLEGGAPRPRRGVPAAGTRRPPLRSPCGDRQNPARRFAPDRRGEGVVVEDMPQASPVFLCPCCTTTEDRTTSLPSAEEQIKAERSVLDSTPPWRCVSGSEAQ